MASVYLFNFIYFLLRNDGEDHETRLPSMNHVANELHINPYSNNSVFLHILFNQLLISDRLFRFYGLHCVSITSTQDIYCPRSITVMTPKTAIFMVPVDLNPIFALYFCFFFNEALVFVGNNDSKRFTDKKAKIFWSDGASLSYLKVFQGRSLLNLLQSHRIHVLECASRTF